jgi:hypothetical protein
MPNLIGNARERSIPRCAAGEAAIYADDFHELSLLRKIRLRKRS